MCTCFLTLGANAATAIFYHPCASGAKVTGIPQFNEDTYTRVNTNTLNFVRAKDGKPVQMGSLAVSDDGKTFCVTVILVGANGQLNSSVGVWEKR
jgi:uncharacterized membrane protein